MIFNINSTRGHTGSLLVTHECVRTLYVLVTLFVAGRRRDTRRHPSQEEEPEWFTGGPSSQSDTIELIGFEVAEEQRAKREAAERKALADSRNSTLYITPFHVNSYSRLSSDRNFPTLSRCFCTVLVFLRILSF